MAAPLFKPGGQELFFYWWKRWSAIFAIGGTSIALRQYWNNRLKLNLRYRISGKIADHMADRDIVANLSRVPSQFVDPNDKQKVEQDSFLFPEKYQNILSDLQYNGVKAATMIAALGFAATTTNLAAGLIAYSVCVAGAATALGAIAGKLRDLRRLDNEAQTIGSEFRDAFHIVSANSRQLHMNGFDAEKYLKDSLQGVVLNQDKVIKGNALTSLAGLVFSSPAITAVGVLPLLPSYMNGSISGQVVLACALPISHLVQSLNFSNKLPEYYELSASARRLVSLFRGFDAAKKEAARRPVIPIELVQDKAVSIKSSTIFKPGTETALFKIGQDIGIPFGEVIEVRGANGAGKSVFFEDIHYALEKMPAESRPGFAYSGAEPIILPKSSLATGCELKRQLAFGVDPKTYADEHYKDALAIAGLPPLDQHENKDPAKWSTGNQKKLMIARAILPWVSGRRQGPFILALDEALANIDDGKRDIILRIRDRFPKQAAIMIVLHGTDIKEVLQGTNIKGVQRIEIADQVARSLPAKQDALRKAKPSQLDSFMEEQRPPRGFSIALNSKVKLVK